MDVAQLTACVEYRSRRTGVFPVLILSDGFEKCEIHTDRIKQPRVGVEKLATALLDRGYGETDIRGILGENFLRVARQVWK